MKLEKLTCTVCYKIFDTKKQLTRHKKIHDKTCNICGEKFENRLMLIIHKKVHQAAKPTPEEQERMMMEDSKEGLKESLLSDRSYLNDMMANDANDPNNASDVNDISDGNGSDDDSDLNEEAVAAVMKYE